MSQLQNPTPSSCSDNKNNDEKKHDLEMIDFDTQLSSLTQFGLDTNINTGEFQAYLTIDDIKKALEVVHRVDVKGIDFSLGNFQYHFSTHAPYPYMERLCEIKASNVERQELLDIFNVAKIVNRESMCHTFSTKLHCLRSYWNPLMYAASATSDAFDFILINVPNFIVDWSVQSPSCDYNSPLMITLSRSFHRDHREIFDEATHDTFDRRSVQLIELLPDHALNVVNDTGFTPITYAILFSRVLALKALLRRSVDLQPELHLKLPHKPEEINHYTCKYVTSIDVALSTLQKQSDIRSIRLSSVIQSIIMAARLAKKTNPLDFQKLKPVLCLLLDRFGPMPKPVIDIIITCLF